MKPQRNQPEERLSEALRHLGQRAEQGAPPEIYNAVVGAFRAHHVRRKRAQRTRIILVSVACLALSVVLLRTIGVSVHGTTANAGNGAVHLIPPLDTEIAGPTEQASHRETAMPHASGRTPKVVAVEDFLALPSYDPKMPMDDLRIIRLEARGSDIRLAGAPIGEELSERRVVADFVVGHDGTPYAVRFVQ